MEMLTGLLILCVIVAGIIILLRLISRSQEDAESLPSAPPVVREDVKDSDTEDDIGSELPIDIDDDDAVAVENLRTAIEDAGPNGLHIDEAIETGSELGLSKRHSRRVIDAFVDAEELEFKQVKDGKAGRPRKYVGPIG